MQRTEKKVFNKDFMNSMKQPTEADVQKKEFKTEKGRQEVEESEYQLEQVDEDQQRALSKTAKSKKEIV